MKSMLEVATICHELKIYRQDGTTDVYISTVAADVWKTRMVDLDAKLHSWYQALPSDWTFLIKPIILNGRPDWESTLLRLSGAPNVIYEYADALIALDVNLYRATRLHLNLTMLEYLRTTESSSNDTGLIVSRIIEIVDDICATMLLTLQITASGVGDPQIPNEIHGRRGHHLLFPLIICGRCYQQAEVIHRDNTGKRHWIEAVAGLVCGELGYAIVPLRRLE
jgi:hypothetical protein